MALSGGKVDDQGTDTAGILGYMGATPVADGSPDRRSESPPSNGERRSRSLSLAGLATALGHDQLASNAQANLRKQHIDDLVEQFATVVDEVLSKLSESSNESIRQELLDRNKDKYFEKHYNKPTWSNLAKLKLRFPQRAFVISLCAKPGDFLYGDFGEDDNYEVLRTVLKYNSAAMSCRNSPELLEEGCELKLEDLPTMEELSNCNGVLQCLLRMYGTHLNDLDQAQMQQWRSFGAAR